MNTNRDEGGGGDGSGGDWCLVRWRQRGSRVGGSDGGGGDGGGSDSELHQLNQRQFYYKGEKKPTRAPNTHYMLLIR